MVSTVKNNIRKIMKQRGMSGLDLAKKMKVQHEYVYAILNGKGINIRTALKLKRVLGCTLDEMFA